jgi:rubredoxin
MKQELTLFLSMSLSSMLFAADTELQLYRPFTETSKQLPIQIIAQKTGECFQQSKLIVREDAWRCSTEGMVYDPCFVKPNGSKMEAMCPGTPWTQQSIEITVPHPLDNTQHATLDMSQTYPWGIELMSGERCYAVEEATKYDDLPVHYRCNEHTVLIGHVQRCNALWKMLQHTSTGISTVELAKAWF